MEEIKHNLSKNLSTVVQFLNKTVERKFFSINNGQCKEDMYSWLIWLGLRNRSCPKQEWNKPTNWRRSTISHTCLWGVWFHPPDFFLHWNLGISRHLGRNFTTHSCSVNLCLAAFLRNYLCLAVLRFKVVSQSSSGASSRAGYHRRVVIRSGWGRISSGHWSHRGVHWGRHWRGHFRLDDCVIQRHGDEFVFSGDWRWFHCWALVLHR